MRMPKVRPAIAFHGEVTMSAMRRRARQINMQRKLRTAMALGYIEAQQRMQARLSMGHGHEHYDFDAPEPPVMH
jgi:hypothetical protein